MARLFTLLGLIPSVFGFTYGPLIPEYICGPPTDGLPKSLGGVLPYFQLPTFPITNVNSPAANGNGGAQATIQNTQFNIAGFHNGQGSIAPSTHEMVITIQAVGFTENGQPPAPNLIYPGRVHNLTLASSPMTAGVAQADVALDGAIIYAVDSNGQRLGSFVNPGPSMTLFNACGPANAGVVHTQLLSGTAFNPLNSYTGLQWLAPAYLSSLGSLAGVTFKGAAVSDGNGMTMGFGSHSSNFLIKANSPSPVILAPSITKVYLANQMASIFFVDDNKGSIATTTQSVTLNWAITSATTGYVPANTIGSANIPATATIAATTPTLANTQTFNAVASPLQVNLATLLGQVGLAGGIMTIQISLTTTTGQSMPSNIVQFSVGNLKTTAMPQEVLLVKNFISPFLNPQTMDVTQSYPLPRICNQVLEDQITKFNMGWLADYDGSCTYLLNLITKNPNPATQAVQATHSESLFERIKQFIF